ncbi:MAG: hypothetical protein ACOYCB_09145 [Fastidiosipilaceae bacterium]|jgi:hypothetical protein
MEEEKVLRRLDLQLFADDGGDAGDAGSDAGGDGKGDKGDDPDTGGDKGKNKDGGDTGDKGGRTFTQDELDAIVRDRVRRERKGWEQKIKEEKEKAAMSEAERLKAEKEEAEKNATAAIERANQRLIRSEVIAQAAKLNIVDPDAAYALMNKEDVKVEDDDTVTGVKKSLEALIKAKPYLVGSTDTKKTGDDQRDDKGSKGGFSMNDLIRKAAGRV